ncbi:hypothetical protein [Hymenobacter jeollabukensis]|uniref:Uncharacterized protein n=1 Tax=Hymenobacter jeollabukensis TaxID=2025313 RepID=A0A5R8WQ37_9BACT|nr:hypothetical protein [Hymenobacter jeollabukensis]TLM92345.1 hypothetical protein FDY95_12995 [Hymenobacter jeollabukensis]
MTRPALTNKPTALRQWLLRSLLWTALGLGLIVGAWKVWDPFLADSSQAVGLRWFGLLLTHLGTTMLLGQQANSLLPLYDEAAPHSPWHLKLATQIWGVLLQLLTWAGLLIVFALLLGCLLVATSHQGHQPWLFSLISTT